MLVPRTVLRLVRVAVLRFVRVPMLEVARSSTRGMVRRPVTLQASETKQRPLWRDIARVIVGKMVLGRILKVSGRR